MEASHSFLHCDLQFLQHNIFRTVLWQLQVVDARHDARKVIVRLERRLVWLAYHRQWRGEPTETYGRAGGEYRTRDSQHNGEESHLRWGALGFQ